MHVEGGHDGCVLSVSVLEMVPLRATVALPELQLSVSCVDFGICFVNQRCVQEISLRNLSNCKTYWAIIMGRSGRDWRGLCRLLPRIKGSHPSLWVTPSLLCLHVHRGCLWKPTELLAHL